MVSQVGFDVVDNPSTVLLRSVRGGGDLGAGAPDGADGAGGRDVLEWVSVDQDEIGAHAHLKVLLTVLREAAERGEAAPEHITERVASVGPRMITIEAWERDQVDPREVEAVVDEVLLPLLQPRR